MRSAIPIGIQPELSLPIVDRLAPPPPRKDVIARIERHTRPGDIVVDLDGRGGWIARAAIERHRRAISFESGPLQRLVAEIVLRPPDVRHLDAAFQTIATAPFGKTSLRLAIGDLYATHCATCDRAVVADEVTWESATERGSGTGHQPVTKIYRCPACRDQGSGDELREAPVDDADRERALNADGADDARRSLRSRFPIPDEHAKLVDQLLGLHSERQLVGLAAILERVEEARAEPLDAALRLAFAGAVLPASRLATQPARIAPLRIAGARVRLPTAPRWHEQSPWAAFEDAFRVVKSFLQRLDAASGAPSPAASGTRFTSSIKLLAGGTGSAVVRMASPTMWRALAIETRELADASPARKVRLVLSQTAPHRTAESFAFEFHATAWALGRDAASLVPLESLLRPAAPTSPGEQSAALARSLAAIEPVIDRDGRVVLLLDADTPDGLVAAALGGVRAGFRVAAAHLAESGDEGGAVELVPPGAAPPPIPRTRANVALPAVPGGAGDPELVPGPGLFTPPERHDARAFSAAEAARTVTETAVDVVRARGEPASTSCLMGEIVVALDRSGQLRRLVDAAGSEGDVVERLTTLIRDELARPNRRRLVEVAPDRWWLADAADRESAAAPLADRVEWAAYSLLSTAGGLSEAAFIDRIVGLFPGHDRPDTALVRACLDSYRSDPDNVERVATTEDLLARTHEHSQLLGALADGGHRLGMGVWISRREQARRMGERRLGDGLDDAERRVHLPSIAAGDPDALEAVDCIWYVPGRATFLFEVEWTAMIGETILRRHARIPPDEQVVRFLAVPAERTALVRHKIDRSPALRDAIEEGNWHIVKWSHLRRFLAIEPLSLDDLEPYLGLEPTVERAEGRQLPLFAT